MLFLSVIFLLVLVILVHLTLKYHLPRRRRRNTIAFFHLYCTSGGGGERVLWHTIEALFNKYPNYSVYIYSHKSVKGDTLRTLLNVKDLFKIDLVTDKRFIDKLEFVPLNCSSLIEAKRYPFLTLLFQNLGSILLACEAAYRITPEIYMETIGFTFTLPVFKLLRCTVITYVHYPTISSDMIQNVRTSTHASFNNREIFIRSPTLRSVKLIYYRILAYLYGLAGRRADLVLVNSSWTQAHISSLWKTKAHVVYPPCDVESFKSLHSRGAKCASPALNIISIAQFRPEKKHQLQIEAFDLFLGKTGAYDSRLTLYGGCREEADKKRVDGLREFIRRLDLESNIEILVGASFERLLQGMKDADVAIHTMENEHFGIVLLECMAAGLLTVAHNSGGPKADIIEDGRDGFLANDLEDFAAKLVTISRMNTQQRQEICERAMKKSDKFSTRVFEVSFIKLVDQFLRR